MMFICFSAVGNIIPTSQRSVSAPSRALPSRVQPLLQGQLDAAFNVLKDIFSPCVTQSSFLDAAGMRLYLINNGVLLK